MVNQYMLGQNQVRAGFEAEAHLRMMIEAGSFAPGDRLPSERDLIHQLGVSRARLRRALDILEREGAIWRHVGKGTFVARYESHGTQDDLANLSSKLSPIRMMQARGCFEPALAQEAALHASAEAIVRMRLAIERSEAASSWSEYEKQDDLFHRSIAEGADNKLLLAMFDQLNETRRSVTWKAVVRDTRCPPVDHPSFAEHRDVASAIENRDPVAARDAMRKHLGSVAIRLFETRST